MFIASIKRELREAVPAFVRAWKKCGYAVCLVVLLSMIGVAAYSYRTGAFKAKAPSEPITIEAAAQPEVVEEQPEPLSFMRPFAGDIVREYAADTLIWSSATKQYETHTGIDIAGAYGERVVAAEAGVVTRAYKDALLGYVVIIEHNDGYESVYASLKGLDMVEVRKIVHRGEEIGEPGDSAISEIDLPAHVHYELRLNGKSVVPE